jgi:hypothetical protein
MLGGAAGDGDARIGICGGGFAVVILGLECGVWGAVMAGMPIQNDRMMKFAEMTDVSRETQTLEEMFGRMTCRVEGVEGPEGRPEGLPAICAAWGVPYGRMLTWLMMDAKRYAVYERALEVAAHADIAEVVGIADGPGFPQEKRVRIDARFRVAESHAREKYGKRLQMDAPPAALVDAGLVGTAVALLEKLSYSRSRQSREIDVTPQGNDDVTDADGDPI